MIDINVKIKKKKERENEWIKKHSPNSPSPFIYNKIKSYWAV